MKDHSITDSRYNRSVDVDNFLEVSNLVKYFPLKDSKLRVHAVNDISFSIKKGETLGLVGESGSGKTTTGRCILRLEEPTSGKLVFNGQDIMELPVKKFRYMRPDFQMVFQEPYESLNPRMTLKKIIGEPLKIWNDSSKETIEEKINEVAEMVKLRKKRLELYPHQVSGGEQQRTSLARSIITSPEFLVLDEPTSLLDPLAQAEIMVVLKDLQKRLNLTYMFISHDLVAIKNVCNRVLVMYLSKIVEEGSTDDIFGDPHHPYTKSLIASVLFPEPGKKPETFNLKGEIPSPIILPEGCYFYGRCEEATEECAKGGYPPRVEVGDNHYVYCWHPKKDE